MKSTPEMGSRFLLGFIWSLASGGLFFFLKNCPLDEANAWTGRDQAVKASRDGDEVG